MGRNSLWMNKHENTLEQIFAEFEDDEDNNENDTSIYSNNMNNQSINRKERDSVQKVNNTKDTDQIDENPDKSNLNSSFNNKVNIDNGVDTQRSLMSNSISSKKDNKKRLVDTMGQVNPMTKTNLKEKQAKDVNKSKMFQKTMTTVKDLVKSELYKDLNNMIDHAVSEHASMINVTQIQKIPENKNESITEEIVELKNMLSKIAAKEETIEKKVQEFERNFPRINMDIGNMRTDMQTKASKDELQSINMQIPNFATKQDIELVFERMKDKTDSQETNDVRISLESLKENQKSYCLSTVFLEKTHEFEDQFKKINEHKANITWTQDKFTEVYRIQDKKEFDLEE